jgi:hypothetical protein
VNVRVQVQCIAHACIVGNAVRVKQWGNLPRRSIEWIAAFCELHAKR